MQFKYLLFDLDGTLTDPKEGITASVQYALKAFGIEEPDTDKLAPFIGPPLKDSFMKFYGFEAEKAEAAVAKYREWFAPKGIFQNKMYPGIADMLSELKESGKILAVASSKPTVFVEKILRHFDIYHYFNIIVGSELNGIRGSKEEVVEEALLQLAAQEMIEANNRLEPQGKAAEGKHIECEDIEGKGTGNTKGKETENNNIDRRHTAMIGDREFDIFGGKEHGLITVGVTFGFAEEGELEAAGADHIVDSVEELRGLLMQ